MNVLPINSSKFDNLHSEKIKGIRASIKMSVESKKNQSQLIFDGLNGKIRELYESHNIHTLVNFNRIREVLYQEKFRSQLKIFKIKNKGIQGYSKSIDNVK